MNMPEHPAPSELGDNVAVGLSALCLAHCLLLPIVVGGLPLFGTLAHAGWVHGLLFALAAPLSIWVLFKGYQHHRQVVACAIGAAGLALLAAGMLHAEHLPSERIASVAGALLLVAAHGSNIWLRTRTMR